jgi:sodium/proline symporter
MNNSSVILATLVAYKIILIAIGFWAQRRTSSNEDFFLGGRRLGPIVAALSYSASASSAWMLLGLSGAAFVMGLSALWIFAGVFSSMLFAWFWIAPRLLRVSHQGRFVTLTDFLLLGSDGRWRRATAALASLVILVSFILYVAAQFQGAGQTFSTTFAMDPNHSILIGGAVIMVYSLLGGFWAVSLTDALQGVLMAIAAILLPTAALVAVGGPGGLMEGLAAVSSESQLSLSAGNAGLAAAGFVVGMMGIGLGTFGQPHLLNRFMALRDSKALSQARLISTAWYFIVVGGMVLLGLCGHVLMPDFGNPEGLLFALTNQLLPVLLAGLVTAAVLSAIMSTADSLLLAAASAVSHDLGLSRRAGWNPVTISRLAMAAISIAAIAVAIFLPEAIFSRVLFAWNAIGAAFGPTIILRLAGMRFSGRLVFAAIAVGFFGTLFFSWQADWPGDFAERVIPFAAGLVLLILGRQRR